MMSKENSGDKPEKGKEKTAKTKPMPLDAAPGFTEWVKKQPKPKLGDKGAPPPEPPPDLKEPREHGTKEPQNGGQI
jgi:hypothetical protein